MAIYLQINKTPRIEVKPTIFPDKTSQVWKVPGIDTLKETDKVYIYWLFEQEAELIWLCQLANLILDAPITYIIPYFPYARQDKVVSNHSCFATFIFQTLLDCVITKSDWIYLLDAHSLESYKYLIRPKLINHVPYQDIKWAFDDFKADIMLMPDEGAFKRYSQVCSMHSMHCIKKRNQETGAIESITVPDVNIIGKRILIVDDICDGGATFIEIAKQLKYARASSISLYVSHGLFSKGKDVLIDAGINKIYTASYEAFYEQVINE